MTGSNAHNADVIVVGGGPAGTTVATLLRKYNPDLSVIILEKAHFPREHIGESQLPVIGAILNEMGAWDKVEAANFPIKLGASYTWGKDNDEWDFDFYPPEDFVDEPRPGKYQGQRRFTAFQVERSRYDEILLRHAEECGAQVREGAQVRTVHRDGDRVTGLELDSGETLTARHYIDATGHTALLRRALGVESVAPKQLRNVAFWAYYDDAKWAIEIGVGGTRIQIRSLPYGWMWFIPLGPRRASVGLVCPSEYYKSTGLTPTQVFERAIADQPFFASLLADAKCTSGDEVLSTKNWSHLADRLVGENWWICGEAAGFADPILSAGMTLAHGTAREVAYSILEIDRGELDADWIKTCYNDKARRNIDQHIRFAEYWYAANSCFVDLKEHCQLIARDSGLRLTPPQAWRWLAQGGFTNQQLGFAGLGSFDIGSTKRLIELFSGRSTTFNILKFNKFKLNLAGATEGHVAELREGRIRRVPCYERGPSILPVTGTWKTMINLLGRESDFETLYTMVVKAEQKKGAESGGHAHAFRAMQALEAMLVEGWVVGSVDKKRPMMTLQDKAGKTIRWARDANAALDKAKGSVRLPDEA
ncbi:MAG: NAD(P)/FAD-dependent oxidoreductase [Phycisphaerales bacterium]